MKKSILIYSFIPLFMSLFIVTSCSSNMANKATNTNTNIVTSNTDINNNTIDTDSSLSPKKRKGHTSSEYIEKINELIDKIDKENDEIDYQISKGYYTTKYEYEKNSFNNYFYRLKIEDDNFVKSYDAVDDNYQKLYDFIDAKKINELDKDLIFVDTYCSDVSFYIELTFSKYANIENINDKIANLQNNNSCIKSVYFSRDNVFCNNIYSQNPESYSMTNEYKIEYQITNAITTVSGFYDNKEKLINSLDKSSSNYNELVSEINEKYTDSYFAENDLLIFDYETNILDKEKITNVYLKNNIVHIFFKKYSFNPELPTNRTVALTVKKGTINNDTKTNLYLDYHYNNFLNEYSDEDYKKYLDNKISTYYLVVDEKYDTQRKVEELIRRTDLSDLKYDSISADVSSDKPRIAIFYNSANINVIYASEVCNKIVEENEDILLSYADIAYLIDATLN